MKLKTFAFWLLAAVLGSKFSFAQGQTILIEPVEKSLVKSNMLVLKPTVQTPYGGYEKDIQELYNLLIFDLSFSGAFQVLEETPEAMLLARQDDQSGTVNFQAWRDLRPKGRAVDILLKTELIQRGSGQYQLNILAYDVGGEARALGQAYGAPPHTPFSRSSFRKAD